ncbi:NADP-dependent oxidoreductase [Amycolatopsis palatopharyngis]|uniref:NADP-dependent oxidoreductase n=1 Tax=Amycolatopsis palatopharyngis TaxID=187982 RepID=UPI000E2582B7|nr:NADP-dependent oxidoreductase [Amycolatopsis palatopharyngis]
MKAVRYHEYGDAGVLRVENIDRPTPGVGQVLLRVTATSFNPVDAGIRSGQLRQVFPVSLPHTPGLDVAGTVAELGPRVTSMAPGAPVIGFLPITGGGAAAEFVSVPVDVLTAAPAALPLADAAALPLAGLTAWQALFQHADVATGRRILINGAGGAVGRLAVQLAKHAGATVVATAGPHSIHTIGADGVDELIDYTKNSVHDVLVEPVDVLLNLVPVRESSNADAQALLRLIRPGGVFVTAVPPVPESVGSRVRVVGMSTRCDVAALAELVRQVDTGVLRVDVAARLPLSEVASVHRQSDAGSLRGKVVFLPGD